MLFSHRRTKSGKYPAVPAQRNYPENIISSWEDAKFAK